MHRKVIVQNNKLLDDVANIVASGKQVILLTKGQSMLPFIVGGEDSVELSKIDSEICVGDILLAKLTTPTPHYIIHRVIKTDGDRITLMGDGNLIGSEECHREDIVARITSIIKHNRRRINPNLKSQQRYAQIWQKLQPIRRYLLATLRRVKRPSLKFRK